jgi:hypothetical protein
MSSNQAKEQYNPISLDEGQMIWLWTSISATIAIYVFIMVFGLVNTFKYLIRQQRYK